MKIAIISAILAAGAVMPAFAGDVAKGETEFRKCRACHMIKDDAGTDIFKGGATGPNLFNIVGSGIAGVEGFRFSDGLLAARKANPDFTWTQDELAAYMTDPNGWVQAKTGDSNARTKMTFRLNSGQADLAAYLASVSPKAQ
ncbi:cytochrome c family protein [Paracoccus sp. (in: a-proteobacteria)]|uniref:c-type cytochrome n=1 Tax=Paracoccus sp. TaxID=267 RepID=UPI0026E05564|nr:cytochrome C [Paracoccus sp. (in: a-proteobacteria)]MDO5646551.1 cytochrome C [Paracoccus sp. (in: a-proteobacteria)]